MFICCFHMLKAKRNSGTVENNSRFAEGFEFTVHKISVISDPPFSRAKTAEQENVGGKFQRFHEFALSANEEKPAGFRQRAFYMRIGFCLIVAPKSTEAVVIPNRVELAPTVIITDETIDALVPISQLTIPIHLSNSVHFLSFSLALHSLSPALPAVLREGVTGNAGAH